VHRWKLFNLRDDIREKNDLAAIEPQRVKEMDALIEKFLVDTGAIVPVPNPAFNPTAYHPENEGKQKSKSKGQSPIEPQYTTARMLSEISDLAVFTSISKSGTPS